MCYIKLKNVKQAESHLELFEKMKSMLPPGHVALRDEVYARDGLEVLKKEIK